MVSRKIFIMGLTLLIGITAVILMMTLLVQQGKAMEPGQALTNITLGRRECIQNSQAHIGNVYVPGYIGASSSVELLGFEALGFTQTFSIALGGAVQGAAIGPTGYYNAALDLGPGPQGQQVELWVYDLSTKQAIQTATLPFDFAYTVEYDASSNTVYVPGYIGASSSVELLGFEALGFTQTFSIALGGAVQGAAIGPTGYYNVALDLGPGPQGQQIELWVYDLSTKQAIQTTTLPFDFAYTVEYDASPNTVSHTVYVPGYIGASSSVELLGFEALGFTQTFSSTLGGAVQGAAIGPTGYYNVALDLGPGPQGQQVELWVYDLSTKQAIQTTTLPFDFAYTVEYAPCSIEAPIWHIFLPLVLRNR